MIKNTQQVLFHNIYLFYYLLFYFIITKYNPILNIPTGLNSDKVNIPIWFYELFWRSSFVSPIIQMLGAWH